MRARLSRCPAEKAALAEAVNRKSFNGFNLNWSLTSSTQGGLKKNCCDKLLLEACAKTSHRATLCPSPPPNHHRPRAKRPQNRRPRREAKTPNGRLSSTHRMSRPETTARSLEVRELATRSAWSFVHRILPSVRWSSTTKPWLISCFPTLRVAISPCSAALTVHSPRASFKSTCQALCRKESHGTRATSSSQTLWEQQRWPSAV